MVDPVVRDSALTLAATASTSLVANMPTIVAGDLLIAIYLQRGSTATCSMNGGFTTRIGSHASGQYRSADVFGKIAAGGDTMTVTKPTTDTAAVIVVSIQVGTFDTAQWTEGFTPSMALTSDSTPPLPDATSTVDRGVAISAAGIRSTSTTGAGLTSPGTWTQLETGFATDGIDGLSVGCCSKLITPAGSTGAYDWSGGPVNNGPELTFVVRPGGGGAPATTVEINYWDPAANGGLGAYVLASAVHYWDPAANGGLGDYLPGTGSADVAVWDANQGQYFPGGTVDNTPPTQPGTITASAITTTTITFDWGASTDDSSGVAGYRIRLNGGSWVDVVTNSYVATGLTPSTAYTPEVQAVDNAGNYSATTTGSAASTTAVADTVPPSTPGQPTAVPSGATVALTWGASNDDVGVTAYDVHRSSTSGFTVGTGTLKGTSATNSLTETNVPTGTWYYKVVARDAAGNTSQSSTQRQVVVSAPQSPMWMGCSDSPNDHGGTEDWDGWRTYTLSAMKARANGAFPPLFHAYSEQGGSITGSYSSQLAHWVALLEDFYFGNASMGTGSGAGSSTQSARWAQRLYISNGNENYETGNNKALDQTVDAYTQTQRAIYDACHTESSPGVRKFPAARAASNPTTYQELSGTVAAYAMPTAQYHDTFFWSMYNPGRSQTVTDPTYNWPSTTRALVDGGDYADSKKGFLGRCFRRTWLAREQARADTGDPNFDITIGCGEIGVPSDPGDATSRPFYMMRIFGDMFVLADEYDLTIDFACYWDNKTSSTDPHNILSDEGPASDHGNTGTPNPTTGQVTRAWWTYDPRRGGVFPSSWAGNPKASWKQTGTYV